MKLAFALVLSSLLPSLGLCVLPDHDHDGADLGLYNPANAFFKRGDRIGRNVALTFDDGPHPTSANEIMDVLKRANIKATFFVVGEMVDLHPEVVRRMVIEGHEVGNHTMTHPRLDTLSPEMVKKEILGCESAVWRATRREMHLMRPPGMHFNAMVLQVAKGLGYDTVGWNVGAKDFTLTKNDPKLPANVTSQLNAMPTEVAERVIENVKNGAIILLHDSESTALALPSIIRSLKAEGYHFETVTEMMRQLPDPISVTANPFKAR